MGGCLFRAQQHLQLAGRWNKAGALLASAFTLSISASNATSRSIRLGKNRERKRIWYQTKGTRDPTAEAQRWRFLGLSASERSPTEGSRSPPPARLCSQRCCRLCWHKTCSGQRGARRCLPQTQLGAWSPYSGKVRATWQGQREGQPCRWRSRALLDFNRAKRGRSSWESCSGHRPAGQDGIHGSGYLGTSSPTAASVKPPGRIASLLHPR